MVITRRKKISKRRKKRIWPLIFLILAVAFLLNTERIGKHVYPFPNPELIFYYAQVNQIDPYLIAAIIKTESSFDNKAVSVKGAQGLMQIMPDTAKWIAEQMGEEDFNTNDLYDPETNIALGSWYIANLQKEFKGDTVLVLAAYNGGRGNVQQWLEKKNWTGEHKTLDQIPFPETRQYVRKVLWNYKMYNYLYNEV